jgi:preprotein translocase subunit SecY
MVVGGIAPVFFIASTVVALTGGTLFLMWLGEQITSRGVGNGVSLIIFTGIVSALPLGVVQMFTQVQTGAMSGFALFAVGRAGRGRDLRHRLHRTLAAPPAGPLSQAPARQPDDRRRHLVHPAEAEHRRRHPPIFASSLLLLPTTAMGFLATANLPNWLQWLPTVVGALQHGQPLFMVLYAALIIFFSFFYTSVVFNPDETAENLRKYGGFMPGIRPASGRRNIWTMS